MLALNQLQGAAPNATETRLVPIYAECRNKLAALGEAGIVKPKDVLQFTRDLTKKSGQQIECLCMFCPEKKITSTGATRVVDHYVLCPLCPKEIKEACQALRAGTSGKRKDTEETAVMAMEERDAELQQIKAQKLEQQQGGIKAGFANAEVACADKGALHSTNKHIQPAAGEQGR